MTEYLVGLGILFVLDILTTKRILRAGGSEGNPVMRTLMRWFGEDGALWGSKAVAFAIIYYLTTKGAVALPALQILTLIYLCVIGWNVYVLRKIKNGS